MIAADLRASLAAFPGATVEPAGAGDYCWAFVVDGAWIFLVARHPEGERSIARAAALLPTLAPALPLAIPDIAHTGRTGGGHAFVGYRKVGGVELTGARYRELGRAARDRCARDLARFLGALHQFPPDVARGRGIIPCPYPFAAIEEGLRAGTAEEEYGRDLERLLGAGVLDRGTGDYCRRILAAHLGDRRNPEIRPVLLHGEVSGDHVLHDPQTGELTGVIDFNGLIIGDPARDLLYLYEDYGLPFLATFLRHYPVADRRHVLARLHFFHEWMTALRLLWVVEHNHPQRVAPRLQRLRALREVSAAPPWWAIA